MLELQTAPSPPVPLHAINSPEAQHAYDDQIAAGAYEHFWFYRQHMNLATVLSRRARGQPPARRPA
jgi:hypothetical protein